jgi:hypothetical protein
LLKFLPLKNKQIFFVNGLLTAHAFHVGYCTKSSGRKFEVFHFKLNSFLFCLLRYEIYWKYVKIFTKYFLQIPTFWLLLESWKRLKIMHYVSALRKNLTKVQKSIFNTVHF